MPWGDSFVSGFAAMADAREKQKRRQQDADLAELDRNLKLDLEAQQLAADADRQYNQQNWQSGENQADRGFKAGESDKDRAFKTSERMGAQDFQAGESQIDRDAREIALDRQLRWEQQKQANELPLEGAKVGIMGRAQAWDEDPANPKNQWNAGRAAYEEMRAKDAADAGGFGAGVLPFGMSASPLSSSPASSQGFPASAEAPRGDRAGKRYMISGGRPVPTGMNTTGTAADALHWAAANPNDPRAAQIRQRLGFSNAQQLSH